VKKRDPSQAPHVQSDRNGADDSTPRDGHEAAPDPDKPGADSTGIIHADPDAVERAFYQAFGTGNLALMGRVWLDGDDACCVHPGGDLLTGRGAILAGWRGILAGIPPIVRFRVLRRQQAGDLVLHLVEQRIGPGAAVTAADAARPPTLNRILATNAYRRTADGWRLVLHHASLPLGGEGEASGSGQDPLPAPPQRNPLH
jgi:ketosteroid isomerase-like protein